MHRRRVALAAVLVAFALFGSFAMAAEPPPAEVRAVAPAPPGHARRSPLSLPHRPTCPRRCGGPAPPDCRRDWGCGLALAPRSAGIATRRASRADLTLPDDARFHHQDLDSINSIVKDTKIVKALNEEAERQSKNIEELQARLENDLRRACCVAGSAYGRAADVAPRQSSTTW